MTPTKANGVIAKNYTPEELCIERAKTYRDQFSLVTWLLDAIFSPNAAQSNVQTGLEPVRALFASFGPKMASDCELLYSNSLNKPLWQGGEYV